MRHALFVILALLLAPALASADDYPSRPIQIIVPFAPGGATDIAARLLQPGLEQALGQSLVIENKSGAAGNIGMELAARAAPDGYTLFFGNIGTVAINPQFYLDLKVKPERDFMPISRVSDTPGIFIARPGFPANSLREMASYVKAHPGKVNYAAAGISTLNTLEMMQFEKLAGLNMTQVPYKGGAGPAIVDLMGGHVDLMCVTFSSASAYVQAGKLKAFAVTTEKRLDSMPDVPTVAEIGYPESVSSSWQGLFAVTGTPQPIVAKLHAAIVRALADQKVREHMIAAGMLPNPSASPEEFKAYIATETAKWGRVVRDVGAKAE
jgi:tripartite-type tricarboxylate transporter receptor subunit TctC